MEINVTLEEMADAWKAIEQAVIHHLDCHKELPSLLFVGSAGIAAISYGALGKATEEMRIILVAHWEPSTTMTVA
jgi:hypothetical protein